MSKQSDFIDHAQRMRARTVFANHTGPAPVQHPDYGDAGYDLVLAGGGHVEPDRPTLFPTNTSVELPPGTWGLILGRSSTAWKRNLWVVPAVIDNGWRGELCIGLQALGDVPEHVMKGDRVAQLIPMVQADPIEWVEVSRLADSPRGTNGFGSTT